jgi:hypothetical protein
MFPLIAARSGVRSVSVEEITKEVLANLAKRSHSWADKPEKALYKARRVAMDNADAC